MLYEENIKILEDMYSNADYDTRGAINAAIYALKQQRARYGKYCPWCDPDDEGHEMHLAIKDSDWAGTRLYDRPDVEFPYCPFCTNDMEW